MLKARLENTRKTEIGPLIELNIYNGDKLEYGAAIIPDGGYQFTCYRMERGAVTQSAIGSSGAINYDKLAMSKLTSKRRKLYFMVRLSLLLLTSSGSFPISSLKRSNALTVCPDAS